MGKPLLAVIRDLALDPAEKAAFEAAPKDYLSRHGHEGVTPDDLREAVSLAADTMDPQVAQTMAPPEGGDTDVLETLQRVKAASAPVPDEVQEAGEVPAETSAGANFDFGAGSSVEPGIAGPDDGTVDPTGSTDTIDELDPSETSLAEDEADEDAGLVFDSATPDEPLVDEELDFDDGQLPTAEDLPDEVEIDDVGAF